MVLLAVGTLSRVVICCEDSLVVVSLVCLSGLFCLSLISRFYSAGNCWHRLSGVRSKLVNQLSRVSRW